MNLASYERLVAQKAWSSLYMDGIMGVLVDSLWHVWQKVSLLSNNIICHQCHPTTHHSGKVIYQGPHMYVRRNAALTYYLGRDDI